MSSATFDTFRLDSESPKFVRLLLYFFITITRLSYNNYSIMKFEEAATRA